MSTTVDIIRHIDALNTLRCLDADTRIETEERVDHLIAQSIAQNCITHDDYSDAIAAMLEVQSADCLITEHGCEYWGLDDDERPWRVHLDREVSS